jgi:hypothetical protein
MFSCAAGVMRDAEQQGARLPACTDAPQAQGTAAAILIVERTAGNMN